MTTDHPITPPPELVEEWANASARTYRENGTYAQHEFALATQAARWGADQELEACCEWLEAKGYSSTVSKLRAARSPKPPSLAGQALEITGYPKDFWSEDEVKTIRRALKRLQELENNG